MRTAGKSGLRMPPVRTSVRNMSKKRGTICRVSSQGEAGFGANTEVVRDSQTTNIVSEAQNATASATTRGAGYPVSARTPTMKVSRAISQASFPRIALM